MIKQFRVLVAGLMILPALSFVAAFALPSPHAAAACQDTFLTFPAWYKGVQDANCHFQPKSGADGIKNTTIVIGLNVVEMILQLVGYVTVVMLIVGGFNYMTSQGDSGRMASAKNTIINALAGLVISVMAVAFVNLAAGALK